MMRVRYNPTTRKWDIHENKCIFIGKKTWVIHSTGYKYKSLALKVIEEN